MGPVIYFQTTGTQTLRVQAREDGFSIDQIVLSPQTYLNSSPGALRDDNTLLPSTLGGGAPPPPNQPPQVTASASVTSGIAPLNVYFLGVATDSDGYITATNWDFGDGQTSNLLSPGHAYTAAGNFTARLTVTDNVGATASSTISITVTNPVQPPPTTGQQVRAISWNAQFGMGTDNVYDLNRQATYMANQSPDVIGMYEVEQSGVKNMPQQLTSLMSQRTGVTWNYYWVPKYPGCTEGNFILTKWQIVSTSYRYLSYQRSVAQATLNINGKVVNFFTTHLDPDSSGYRSTQINEMKNFMSGFAEPRIVAGDFNAGPDWPEIASMTANYFDSWNEAYNAGSALAYPDNPVVWMTRTRRGRIDYIFYSRGASNLTLTGTHIPDLRDLSRTPVQYIGTLDDKGVRPSDHNMMVATFQVR
ncbi:MAG: endonuclease/exonuclease/phosphatase family protein, partial [Acidobacteriota bacterium]